ncbi:MAG: DNA recombination protein RmuC [Candidatus Nanopelagicales bacterium]
MDITTLAVGLALGLTLGLAYAFHLRAAADSAHVALAQSEGRLQQLEQHNRDLAAAAQRQQSLDDLLRPMAEGLSSVTRAAQEADRRRVEAETRIQTEIENIKTSNEYLGSATRQLVAAMSRGQSRGQWGEMQLEQLLSHAGLVEGVHFRRQDTRGGNENALRPDLVVLMPGGGEVLVDAKFPWDAFFEAMGSDDQAVRLPLLQKHSRDLAARVNELARKDYAASSAITPDFVILFLPLEPLLSTALDQDGLLLEKAFSKRVIPATPTTMVGLLRTIGFAWNRHDLAVNAEEIRNLSREMLARLGTMVGHLNDTGDQLRRAVDSYNRLVGSFDSRVVSQARRIAELGVPGAADLSLRAGIDEQPRSVRTEAIES